MIKGWTQRFRIGLASAVLAIGYLAFTPLQHKIVTETWDKGNHFIAFLTLAILLDCAWPTFGSRPFHKIGVLLSYGLLIECVQALIPNRQFSLRDVLADSVGISAYYLTYCAIIMLRRQRSSQK